jgi:hypothetical protein
MAEEPSKTMIYAAAGLSGVIFLTGVGLNFAYGFDGKKKDVGKFVMTLATVVLALFNLVHSRTALILSIIGCIIAFIGTIINVNSGDAQAKMATGDLMVFLGSTLCSISAGMIIGELITWKWIDNYSAENAANALLEANATPIEANATPIEANATPIEASAAAAPIPGSNAVHIVVNPPQAPPETPSPNAAAAKAAANAATAKALANAAEAARVVAGEEGGTPAPPESHPLT